VSVVALDPKLLDDSGRVDVDAWRQRLAGFQHVGRHGHCGGALFPAEPETVDDVIWLTVTCSGCGNEMTQPAGRQLARR
jgi:hypothetical protein